MIGEIIAEVRTARGMTRKQLSEASGKSVPFISLIESGKRNPSMTTIIEIAKTLSIPLPILVHSAYPTYALGAKEELDKLAIDFFGSALHND